MLLGILRQSEEKKRESGIWLPCPPLQISRRWHEFSQEKKKDYRNKQTPNYKGNQ
jgi:hypothetical protein